jgi:hypothetical protein
LNYAVLRFHCYSPGASGKTPSEQDTLEIFSGVSEVRWLGKPSLHEAWFEGRLSETLTVAFKIFPLMGTTLFFLKFNSTVF